MAAYLVASIGYLAHLFAEHPRARRLAVGVLVAGFVLHTLVLGERWFNPEAPRFAVGGRMVLTIAWLMVLTQLLLERRPRWSAIGALAIPIAFLAVFYGYLLAHASAMATPLTRGPLMTAHLAAIILGFAGFALA